MAFLWSTSPPSSPADVHQGVAPDLAYTTIMTVLTRLWDKGFLDRERKGRAYVYTPVRSEADHRAAQMQSVLEVCGDRKAALSSFVQSLGKAERRQLRTLLENA